MQYRLSRLLTAALTLIMIMAMLPTKASASFGTQEVQYASGEFRAGSWGYIVLGSYYKPVDASVASWSSLPSWVTIYKSAGFSDQLFVTASPPVGQYTFDLVANKKSIIIHVKISITPFVHMKSVAWCRYAGEKATATIPAEFTNSVWSTPNKPSWLEGVSYYGSFTFAPLPVGIYTFVAIEKWPLGENDYVATLYIKEKYVNGIQQQCHIP
jgi:hypothetical protein